MTNHVQKIAKKLPLNQISTAATATEAHYALAQALLNGTEWQLLEGEKTVTPLLSENIEFSVNWGKLIFAWWTDEQAESWRILAYGIGSAEICLQVARGMGREQKMFVLRDMKNASSHREPELTGIERRRQFMTAFPQILQSNLHGVKIKRVSGVRPQPGPYVRLLLRYRHENILAVGINATESQPDIDGLLVAGLQGWMRYKTPIQKIWLCVPSQPPTILERLTLLDFSAHKIQVECFIVHEQEKTLEPVRPCSQGELLSLHPHGLQWPAPKTSTPHRWRDRLMQLAPDIIETRPSINQTREHFAIHGLTFAYTKGDQLLFGVASDDERRASTATGSKPLPRVLSARSFAQLENLVQSILTFRRADTPDSNHPFYRLRTEAWLESLLRRNIRALDATLNPEFVYSQVPAWIGAERGILDLLTVNHENRLVVIEIKAVEDAQLPLQGLDYWLRVEQARLRGEFARRGLFPNLRLADQSPLLYFAAPRLRFHRSFNFLANCITPEVEAYRLGLNLNWRTGIKVHSKEKVGISA